MEKRKLVKLTRLVECMDDLKYIEDIDNDEYNFIFDKKNHNVLPIDKFRFLIELKKINDEYNFGCKGDNYYTAFIEAKKIAMRQDRNLFMNFAEVALSPKAFSKSYNHYLDFLTTDFNDTHRAEIREAMIKAKYFE